MKHVILFGDLAEMLARASEGRRLWPDLTQVATLAEAVEVAAETAVSGDIVLLSPGGTSFDAFQRFCRTRRTVSGIGKRITRSGS